jgi:hypothetical protein
MIILFRSCEANLSAGSLGDGTKDKPRWSGKYKAEILRKCYLSLQTGLDANDHIIIINDRTSAETLNWMKTHTSAMFSVVDITPLSELRENHPYPSYHPIIPNACTDLMELLVDCAERNSEELIYVCEDDYLHVPHAITAMKTVFSQGYPGFYAPYDYPDRYTIDSSRTCEIHAGFYSHLRSIPSATLTVAALGKTWSRYKYDLLRAGVFADDSWTWKAFSQVGALAPIPGHATHLQDNCISPYINWSEIYESIQLYP